MEVNDIVKIKEVLVTMQDCLSNTSTPVLYIKLEEDLANRLSDFLEKLGYSTNVFEDVIKSSDEYVLAVDTSKGQLIEEKAIIFLHSCADDTEVIKLPFTVHVTTDYKYFLFSEGEVDTTLVHAIVALYTDTEPKLSYDKDIRCFSFTPDDSSDNNEETKENTMKAKSVKQILEDIKIAIKDPGINELWFKTVNTATTIRLEYMLDFLGYKISQEYNSSKEVILKVRTDLTATDTKPIVVLNEDYTYCIVDMPTAITRRYAGYVITENSEEPDVLSVQTKVENALGHGFGVCEMISAGCFLVYRKADTIEKTEESEEITLITLVKEYNEKIDDVKFGDVKVFEIDASKASEEVRKDFFDLMVAANNPMEFEADFSKFTFDFSNEEKLFQNVEIWDEDECVYVPLAWHGKNSCARVLMDKRQSMEHVLSRLEHSIYPMNSVHVIQCTVNNSIYFVTAK